MAPKPLTQKQCSAAVLRLLEAQAVVVHCDDIGPLLGQAATLCDEVAPDATARRYWPQAVSAALAGSPVSRVEWAHAVKTSARSQRRLASKSAARPKPRARDAGRR